MCLKNKLKCLTLQFYYSEDEVSILVIGGCIIMLELQTQYKNETQYWENHQKNITDYKTRFPGFSKHLDEVSNKAKPIWEEAGKLSNEEEKAKKMSEANDMINKLLAPMSRYENFQKSAEEKRQKCMKAKYPKSLLNGINSDIKSATDKLGEAQTKMLNANPTSLEEAIQTANDAGNIAMGAGNKFDEIIKKASK